MNPPNLVPKMDVSLRTDVPRSFQFYSVDLRREFQVCGFQDKSIHTFPVLQHLLPYSSHSRPKTKIVDITQSKKHEERLFRCLAPMPFRKYKRRLHYLEAAIPRGFHKKIALLDDDTIGQIEYAPAEVSGLPISGDRVVVMNCIWVLRRAKGHDLGRVLLEDSIREQKDAAGFATIGLEGHFTPWMKRDQLERLGFVSIDSVRLRHKVKQRKTPFVAHLMWLPLKEEAEKPTWDIEKVLEGVTFCMSHPLYNPESLDVERIHELC